MIKLIKLIVFITVLVGFWNVYSRPEIRQALFMAFDTDSEGYESDYYDDHEYDDPDDEPGDYNYD